tara:strand:+ start:1 stop:912 length:912 start_codon:yes stop_codon:yes gene_type:complete
MDIAIKPLNGLGNRFRFLCSSLSLSIFFGEPLKIFWGKSSGFDGASLDQLIDLNFLKTSFNIKIINEEQWVELRSKSTRLDEKINRLKEPDLGRKNSVKKSERRNRSENIKSFLSKKWNSITIESSENLISALSPEIKPFFHNAWNWYMLSCLNLGFSSGVKERAAECEGLIGNTFGMHLRRGDSINSDFNFEDKKKYSLTLEPYIRKANELLRENSYDNFFLSTDCELAQNRMAEIFGDKVFFRDKPFVKSEWKQIKHGQLDARIDQYLLSKTKFLVYPQRSTFSNFARLEGSLEGSPIICD